MTNPIEEALKRFKTASESGDSAANVSYKILLDAYDEFKQTHIIIPKEAVPEDIDIQRIIEDWNIIKRVYQKIPNNECTKRDWAAYRLAKLIADQMGDEQ